MILDKRTEFADAVSVAAAAGTALIGSQIDLQAAGIDVGRAADLWFVITVDTEIITGGAAGTLQFILASDDSASIATNGSATVHYASRAYVTDGTDANDQELKAGGMPVCVKLPAEPPTYERYLGVLAVTATTTTTAGKINAFLTPVAPKLPMKYYADANQ